MNVIWIVLVVASVCAALLSGKMDALSGAMIGSSKSAVELAFGLVGPLCRAG